MANSEIRIGRVSSINYETGMTRVTYRDKDETVTSEFPMLTNNEEYRMPEIGQQVLVAHLSNGSSRGAVIGTVWNQKNIPKESGKGLYRKDLSAYKDAAYIRYSDETGEYLIKVANLHLNGVNGVVMDGPHIEIAANLSILLSAALATLDVSEITVTGGPDGTVTETIEADKHYRQEGNPLTALILRAALELVESLEVKTGTSLTLEAGEQAEITAGTSLRMHGAEGAEISTDGELRLSDGEHSITLREIIEKLGGE